MSEQSSIQNALSKISKDAFERQSALERQRMRLANHAPKVAEEVYPLFKAYVQAMNEMPGDKSRLAIKDDRLLILRRGVFYRHLQNTAIGVQEREGQLYTTEGKVRYDVADGATNVDYIYNRPVTTNEICDVLISAANANGPKFLKDFTNALHTCANTALTKRPMVRPH